MKRLLVTGASGFVGQWVQTLFGDNPDWGHVPVALAEVDIRDADALAAAVAAAAPDAVLHLAAQSFVPRSFDAPAETFEINLFGTLNLLQALKRIGFGGRMVYVSSGDVFGRVPDAALPVTEAHAPEPRSPYAVSKIAAEQLCLQWHRTEALDVMIARPFNHIGPGQDARFVVPALARQVRDVAAGRADAIDAGDIDTTRDFTDVRDIVAAYAAMLARGASGATYLVASGVERRVRDLLQAMCALEGVDPPIRQDASKLRPAEQRRMVADAGRLQRDTGWRPRRSIDATLRDILDAAGTPNQEKTIA